MRRRAGWARLERAATRIAVGEFGEPIGDESPDELGELARAFDAMQHRLEQADRSRKDFIANASHELRTPLFTLGGFLELLDDEDLDPATRESSCARCATGVPAEASSPPTCSTCPGWTPARWR